MVGAPLLVRLIERATQRGLAVAPDLKARFPMLEQRANRYLPLVIRLAAARLYRWPAGGVAGLACRLVLLVCHRLGRRVGGTLRRSCWCSAGAGRLGDPGGGDRAQSRQARPRGRAEPDPSPHPAAAAAHRDAVRDRRHGGADRAVADRHRHRPAAGRRRRYRPGDRVRQPGADQGHHHRPLHPAEDQIAVGDIVDVGKEHAGVVEAITIRTIRLRDQGGAVHTVPFSEVTRSRT